MQNIIASIQIEFPTSVDPNILGWGLRKIDMPRIGSTVVLAGRNGSGKSRLLRLVSEIASNAHSPISGNYQFAENGFIFSNASPLESPRNPIQIVGVPAERQQNQPLSSSTERDFEDARTRLSSDATNYGANLALATRMAQAVLKDFLNTQNPLFELSSVEIETRTYQWEHLSKTVGETLSVQLGFNNYGQLTLDGRNVDDVYNQFSDGQKKLFTFLVSLSGKSRPDSKQIIIFDEPETNLHPEAAIKMINLMQRVLKNGQLWIATHSIPLIAGLGLENVWFAENGSISYGGKRSKRVIESLLGGKNNITSLRDLIAEPDRVAMARFATQCLHLPESAPPAAANDPQALQEIEAFERHKTDTGNKVQVLDWGAGRGRLADWLADQGHLHSNVEYMGFEPFPTPKTTEEKDSQNSLEIHNKLIFSDIVSIREKMPGDGFDFVVLSNVLHEIPPGSWQQTFQEISSLLRKTGKLLILEDSELPIGELPNEWGYLLIDKNSCAKLFDIAPEEIEEIHPKSDRYKNRLKCFVVPKEAVVKASKSSITFCFSAMNETSLLAIQDYRKFALELANKGELPKYEEGLKHALQTMLFANSRLAIDELDSQK